MARHLPLVAWAALVAAASAQDFPVPVVAVGHFPMSVAVADLGGDGRPDFVAALQESSEETDVSVSLSLPDGGWAAPVGYVTLKSASDLAIGELDDDGLLDVAVCHSISPFVSVLRGTGGGALAPAVSYFVAKELRAVRLGDLDGDARSDLVTLSSLGAGTILVNLADGTGGFLATTTFPAGGSGYELELADMNLDGDLDAVAAHWETGTVVVLLGDGAGGLAAPVPQAVAAGQVEDLCVADATGDGLPDAVLAAWYGTEVHDSIELLAGDGAGGLLPAVQLPAGGSAVHVDVADVDGDAAPDVLASVHGLFPTSFGPDGLAVLRGLGGGAFAAPAAWRSQTGPEQLFVVDVDGDGLLDAATARQIAEGVGIQRGDGRGGFESLTLLGVELPNSIDVADLDGDAQLDLLTAGGDTHVVNVLLADGAGGFLPPAPYVPGTYPVDARAGDFDGQGGLDVLVAGTSPSLFALMRGDGQGGLLAPTTLMAPDLAPDSLELSDLDGDGDLDALASGQGTFGSAGRVQVVLGNGAGGIQLGASAAVGLMTLDLAAGDLDGNGTTDALVANYGSDDLSIVLCDGSAGLRPAGTLPVHDQPQGVALADFDIDGTLDAVAVHGQGGLALLAGDGAGGLGTPAYYQGLGGGGRVAAGDVDGDGAPDVVAPEPVLRVAVWRGDGAGGLLTPLRFGAGSSSTGIAIADLDGDARPELLVAGAPSSYTQGSIAVLANLTETFTWANLGFALAGSAGEPQLVGQGELLRATPGTLDLFHARPQSLAVLFVGAQAQPAAFKGGTLVPVPPLVQFMLATDAIGAIALGWSAWPSSAPGQDWYFQYGIADPAAVHGVALSNALRATEP